MSLALTRAARSSLSIAAVRCMSSSTKAPLKDREIAAEKQYFNVEDEKLLKVRTGDYFAQTHQLPSHSIALTAATSP